MKRDMDLIREILVQIQDHKVEHAGSWQVRINDAMVSHHGALAC